MRFVEVKYNQPAGNATKTFVFADNAKGEVWARNLSKIRDSLPFSSIIEKVKLYDSIYDEVGFDTQHEVIWESGQ